MKKDAINTENTVFQNWLKEHGVKKMQLPTGTVLITQGNSSVELLANQVQTFTVSQNLNLVTGSLNSSLESESGSLQFLEELEEELQCEWESEE